MIIDNISNIGKYNVFFSSSPKNADNFREAVDFITSRGLCNLTESHYDIKQNDVFCNIQNNRLSHGEAAYEMHKKYADIQIIIHGAERFCTCIPDKQIYIPDNEDGSDFYKYENVSNPVEFTLTDSQFVIFLPNEPHAPGLYSSGDDMCRKMVVKIKMVD